MAIFADELIQYKRWETHELLNKEDEEVIGQRKVDFCLATSNVVKCVENV